MTGAISAMLLPIIFTIRPLNEFLTGVISAIIQQSMQLPLVKKLMLLLVLEQTTLERLNYSSHLLFLLKSL